MLTLALLTLVFAEDSAPKFQVSPGFVITKGQPVVEVRKYRDPGIRYMPAAQERLWLDSLPRKADPALLRLLGRHLIVYDHDVLPRVSQDYGLVAWDGEYNRSATGHQFGVTTRDPQWRNTAGFPEHTKVVNFLALPDEGDIDVFPDHVPNGTLAPNYGGTIVRARFPKGTTFLEAGYNQVGNDLLCFEIRSRTKVSDGYGVHHWRANRFVPVREAGEFEEATGLRLKDYRKSRFGFSSSRFPSTELIREAYEVHLPRTDAETTRRLLSRPFRSTLDKTFADFEDDSCHAPTTEHAEQIYPVGYKGGFFATGSTSCSSCHSDDAKHAFTEIGPGDWYGILQSYDSVLSWTPIAAVPSGHAYPVRIDPRIINSPRVKVHGGLQ